METHLENKSTVNGSINFLRHHGSLRTEQIASLKAGILLCDSEIAILSLLV